MAAPQFPVNTNRFDPYKQFKFRVKWDGKTVAGITKVSGLKRTTEVVVHREGGDRSLARRSPGDTAFAPIILERGRSHDPQFENWANMVFNMQGDAAISMKNFRKDLIIELLNEEGMVALSFKIYRCWPSEYVALNDLDANGENAVAIESLTLQHEGWERDTSVTEPKET